MWCRREEAHRLKSFTDVFDDGTTIEIVDGWPTPPVYVNGARIGSLVRRGLSWRFESAAKGFTAKGGAAGFTWEGACRDFVRAVQEGGRVARYVWLLRSRVKTGSDKQRRDAALHWLQLVEGPLDKTIERERLGELVDRTIDEWPDKNGGRR